MKFVTGLARYLCLQNYKPEDIMILTTHKDQISEISKVLLDLKEYHDLNLMYYYFNL